MPAQSPVSTPGQGNGQLYHGASDGFTRAFEIALIPPMFGAAGYALDRWFSITPVLTIAFVLLACVGVGVRIWYAYQASMAAEDAGRPWASSQPPGSLA